MSDLFDALWSIEPLRAIQAFFGPGWIWLFAAVTLLGAHEVVALVAALALWLHGRRLAYALLGIVALTLATDMLLWEIVDVPRPAGPGLFVYKQAPVSSFPSGHVVVATTVWGLLAERSRLRCAAAGVIILLVLLSRLYLGMHFLGDVLGGALIGLLLLRVYGRVWPPIARWLAQRSFRFFLIAGLGLTIAILPFTLITARAWVAFGGALGAAIGLPCEYRYVRSAPGRMPLRWQATKALLGVAVAAALMLSSTTLGWRAPLFEATAFALAALWLTMGAPAVFVWLGLSEQPECKPSPGESTSHA